MCPSPKFILRPIDRVFNCWSDEISLIRLAPNRPGAPLSMRRDLFNVFGFLSPGHLQADLMDLLNACGVQSTGCLIVDLTRSLYFVWASTDQALNCPIGNKFVNPFGIQLTGYLIVGLMKSQLKDSGATGRGVT